MMKASKRTLLFAAAGFCVLFLLYKFLPSHAGTSHEFSRRNSGPLSVATEKAQIGDIHVMVTALGTVTAFNTTLIKSRVDGQLLKLNFVDGQAVKAGDLLAEIDPGPYQALLQQTKGQLTRDQALLANAKADWKRYQDLFAEDSVSKQQLDTQAALVKQYEAAINTDQGAMDSAKLQLDYCHITAPVAGRLGLHQVDVGNMVHAADVGGLVTLNQLQPTDVVFSLPEDDIDEVSRAMQHDKKLPVEAWDRSLISKLATGKLLALDNQIDATTGSVKLRARFENENVALFPNQFVNVRMQTEVKHHVLTVSARSVQLGRDGSYVYVVKSDHTVQMRPIVIGVSEEDRVVVEKGLADNEVVVIDGVDQLHDGSSIVMQTGAEAGDTAPASVESPSASTAPDDKPHKHHHKN